MVCKHKKAFLRVVNFLSIMTLKYVQEIDIVKVHRDSFEFLHQGNQSCVSVGLVSLPSEIKALCAFQF